MEHAEREVRFGLVMNGGVSLAVWIGGVTHELDRLRTASEARGRIKLVGTEACYRDLLKILKQRVVIDVIAGASAGGINGILLGAAIANGKAVPDLRETWISVGDFRALLRAPAESNPRSLLQGDAVVLPEILAVLDGVYKGPRPPRQKYLYLYVSATDLRGYTRQFHDSTGRIFEEREHRRMLGFELDASTDPVPQTMAADQIAFPWGDGVDLRGSTASRLLAEAARSTSSFPVAFEPHRTHFVDEEGQSHRQWLIDGGVLDNQPFNPVLDRISVLPGGDPIKRVIAYVVPYVNEPGSFSKVDPSDPTAVEMIGASGSLPRDLPKLQGLDRVVTQRIVQSRADEDRRRAWVPAQADAYADVAQTLFNLYRQTRLDASYSLYAAWASPGFQPGGGVHGQDPGFRPEIALTRRTIRTPNGDDAVGLPWVPGVRLWAEGVSWSWGFAVAERVAGWALLFLRDALRVEFTKLQPNDSRLNQIVGARAAVSELVFAVRREKERLVNAFRDLPAVAASIQEQRRELERPEDKRRDMRPNDVQLREWALKAYKRSDIQTALSSIQETFVTVDSEIAALNEESGGWPWLPNVQQLLDLEIIRNASSIDSPDVPFPFEFLFMSAGVGNSLGHPAKSPAKKLAGIKLGHFAGFLKRSWRANDWLWGRMDGVEHVLRALLDADLVVTLADDRIDGLAMFAFPHDAFGEVLAKAFGETSVESARADFKATLGEARAGFRAADPPADAVAQAPPSVSNLATSYEAARVKLEHCRKALAARIQLEILEEDTDELARIAKTVDEDLGAGASRISRGVYWKGKVDSAGSDLTPARRRDLFCALDIADEDPREEASSRLVMGVGAQAAAVASALVAGDRGGLPLAARSALATVRGVTLSVSAVVRLLARQPAIGAAMLALLVGLFVWGLVGGGAVLGIVVPGLGVAVVVGAIVLLTIAVSMLEAPLWNLRRAGGFAVLLGVPLAFVLIFGRPGWNDPRGWLQAHANGRVVDIVVALALLAVVFALGRLALELARNLVPAWLRGTLGLYRAVIVAASLILLGGFFADRWIGTGTSAEWRKKADEHKGIILLGAFLLVTFVTGIVVEVLYPWLSRRSAGLKKRAP